MTITMRAKTINETIIKPKSKKVALNEGFWATTTDYGSGGDETERWPYFSRGGMTTEIDYDDFYIETEKLLNLTEGVITDEVINHAKNLILNNTPFFKWLEINKGKTVDGSIDDETGKLRFFSY